jgi:enterochelin esterase-like enzyme
MASAGPLPSDVSSTTQTDEVVTRVQNLPAPFSDWNVEVSPLDGQAGGLTMSYDSSLLGIRTDTSVYLPASYESTGAKSPVMYYLHGTVIPPIDHPELDPATGLESLLDMTAAGGGAKQTELFDFPAQREAANFLVVAPDTNTTRAWCENCMWADGRMDIVPNVPGVTGEVVPAEQVLYTEIMPLVESLFNARTDAGGRGVIGFSMGGWSAMLQGFRHPDRFAFVGSLSGPFDVVDEPVINGLVNVLAYFRDQGFGTQITNPVAWRNYNPRDLATNWLGTGGALMISAGDACILPTDSGGAADCAKYPPLRNPVATTTEVAIRRNLDLSIGQLEKAGVRADQQRFSGIHGANEHRVYGDVIVPTANRVFAEPLHASPAFSYRTADPRFTVWDYQVDNNRTRPAFLSLEDAARDGTTFGVRGVGAATITTPPGFTAGMDYPVTISNADGAGETTTVTAAADGRLRVQVPLDDARFRSSQGLLGQRSGFVKVAIAH